MAIRRRNGKAAEWLTLVASSVECTPCLLFPYCYAPLRHCSRPRFPGRLRYEHRFHRWFGIIRLGFVAVRVVEGRFGEVRSKNVLRQNVFGEFVEEVLRLLSQNVERRNGDIEEGLHGRRDSVLQERSVR